MMLVLWKRFDPLTLWSRVQWPIRYATTPLYHIISYLNFECDRRNKIVHSYEDNKDAWKLDRMGVTLLVPLVGEGHHMGTIVIVTATEGDVCVRAVRFAVRREKLYRYVDVT